MDGLLLRINYDFLTFLGRNGLKVGPMRVKHVPRNRSTRSFVFKSYGSGAEYIAMFSSAMLHPRFLCSAGEFPLIESIEVTNDNLTHHSSYRWYNLFGATKMVKTIQDDGKRNDRYELDSARYEDFQRQRIAQYVLDATSGVDVRLSSYVDPCYVDAGYISPNSDPAQV